jgi:hypothetical protein
LFILKGFWCGDKLVRILSILQIDYEMPDIDPIDRTVNLNSWYDRETLLYETLNPQNIFCNKYSNEKLNRFMREDPYLEEILFDKKEMVDKYLKICSADVNIDHKIYHISKFIEVLNTTRNLIEIFKHTEKYSSFGSIVKEKYGLDLSIFEGNHLNRKDPGSLETASVDFLQACIDQNLEKMKSLKSLVNINVCDNEGLNALLIAVVRTALSFLKKSNTNNFFFLKIKCNIETINFLLDNGANVNHILDNGLTALMICVIRYYTSEKFLPNTALKHKDLVSFL